MNFNSNALGKYSSSNDLFSEKCPYCLKEESIVDPQRGERICSNCGTILESRLIDSQAEWRDFHQDINNSRSRVGLPSSLILHDKGLPTVIDSRDYDAKGQKLSPRNRQMAYKLRKWQIRLNIQTSRDRNLSIAMSELIRVSYQLNLTKLVQETAALLYRRSVDMNIIKGRTIESMVAASLYTSCRLLNIPKSLDEICDITSVTKHDLSKSYRVIVHYMHLRIPTIIPARFVSKFAHVLKISPESQYQAAKILRFAQQKGITSGKDPSSLAAASLYLATLLSGENKTQKEIAEVAKITEVTVRNRYKELMNSLNLKIN
ncbi:MAG: transcription initiation factor IIB [Candidatus Lokiarchaeota archaeon]|nr:transcription initiation factor IIB [Candidatus Harpocratesius repetitus]